MNEIIIDANLLRNIAQGNVPAAEALKRLLSTPGVRVYVARAAYNELVSGTNAGQHYRTMLQELGIEPAPPTSLTSRANAYADNLQRTPRPSQGITGPMPEYGGRRDPISGDKTRPADAFVAAEAKARNAELWTLDKQFARQAAQQGVKISPLSQIPSVSGVEDLTVGRKLMGLRYRWTGWKQRINLKVRGIAILRGLGVAVILGLIGGWLEERKVKSETEEGLEDIQPKIDKAVMDLDRAEVGKFQLRLDKGEKTYANVAIQIVVSELMGSSYSYNNARYPDAYSKNGWVTVSLIDVQISSKNISSQNETHPYGARVISIVQSYEIGVYTEEELEHFRDLSDQYFKAKRIWQMNGSTDAMKQVSDLSHEIIHTYGDDVWFPT